VVKCFIFLLFCIPFFLFSGEFTATVNQNKVYLGETFTLDLTLKGVSAKDFPNTKLLKQAFFIQSQQQASNTTIVNGTATTSTHWKISLIPQEEGRWEIPSISVVTSEGTLSTEPIRIEVLKGTISEVSPITGVEFTATVSQDKPYKNQPILYTLKLESNQSLANLQLEKIQIDDVIIEANGEPKIYDRVRGGVRFDIVEFSYFITPLKSGSLKIPSFAIQGSIPNKKRGYGSNSLDPFLMMQGFDRLEPFLLRSQEITLDVQPAIVGLSPWIPATSLKIEEIFNESEAIQVGAPFSRSFKITGEGIRADQLPSLKDLQVKDNLFKIYADNPELSDEVRHGKIQSFRKEQYTLIPTQSGSLVLPEISITWWDSLKKERSVAVIPSRILEATPILEAVNSPKAVDRNESSREIQVIHQKNSFLYIIIAFLILFLMAALFFGVFLLRKIKVLSGTPIKNLEKKPRPFRAKKSIKKDKKEKLPDLNPT